ncbi:hypothetical protein JCM11491_002588 [Sporobolomyces phaffii]
MSAPRGTRNAQQDFSDYSGDPLHDHSGGGLGWHTDPEHLHGHAGHYGGHRVPHPSRSSHPTPAPPHSTSRSVLGRRLIGGPVPFRPKADVYSPTARARSPLNPLVRDPYASFGTDSPLFRLIAGRTPEEIVETDYGLDLIPSPPTVSSNPKASAASRKPPNTPRGRPPKLKNFRVAKPSTAKRETIRARRNNQAQGVPTTMGRLGIETPIGTAYSLTGERDAEAARKRDRDAEKLWAAVGHQPGADEGWFHEDPGKIFRDITGPDQRPNEGP